MTDQDKEPTAHAIRLRVDRILKQYEQLMDLTESPNREVQQAAAEGLLRIEAIVRGF